MDATKKVCCVRDCPGKNAAGLTYFSLPVDKERRLEWLQAIGRPDLNREGLKPNKYAVCSIHFDKNQIDVLKQVLPDTIPTKNVPRKRKGVLISASTTASQTDFSSSNEDDEDDDFEDDDDDDNDSDNNREFVDTNKRRRSGGDDAKVIVYKRCKPNRKIFVCSGIQYNEDLMICANDPSARPTVTLIESVNLPRDSIGLGNRKIYLFHEDENFEKRNDGLEAPMSIVTSPKVTTPEVPMSKVAWPEVPIVTHEEPLPKVPISGSSLDCNVPNNTLGGTGINTAVGTNINNVKGTNNSVNGAKPIISNVVSLSNAVNNEILNKFIEWKDRTKEANFDKDFNMFALNLHTINTRAYKILIDAWKLPKENELKHIELKIGASFDEQMTRLLTQKFTSLSNEAKYCTLGFYAMALKPYFYYDPAMDEIIGVQNVNGVRKKMAAGYALIAMVRGIQVSWQLPVAFSLLSTMDDVNSINVFIINVCIKLKKMGLKIVGIVLGDDPFWWNYCRAKHLISPSKHYITTDRDKFYVIFDIPHILNRFKNDFIKNDFIFENDTVSWQYVKEVYDLDKERGGRILSKLSDEHFKANSKEKSLKYPCQVFSKTVHTAIHFYIELGLMPVEAVATADFIKRLNDAFDVLNIKNASKLPISTQTKDVQMRLRVRGQCKALEDAHVIFKRLASENDKELDTLNYFIISLKSLIFMSSNLKFWEQKGIAQSRFCNLEPLLDFIKEIKADAKTSKPSPVQFTRAFSKLFLKHLIDLTPSPKSIGNMADFLKIADDVKDCPKTYDGARIRLKDTDHRFSLPKQYAIIYVASFLVYKCSKRHTCEAFQKYLEALVDLNKTKIYVHFEGYNKDAVFYNELKLPAFAFVSFVEKLDDCFIKEFEECYHPCPAESAYISLTSVPKSEVPCPCFPMDYMLKLFVRTRIYQTMVYNTQCLKEWSTSDPPCILKVQKL